LGVALAFGGLQAILRLVPPGTIPDESEIALNVPVLLFTLAVCAFTSILFGLAPALYACVRDVSNALRATGRGVAGSLRQTVLRKGLVVSEVALSLMLLVGASLMIRTFLAMQEVNLGFRADRLLTLRIPLAEQRYPDTQRRNAFFQELLERVKAIPGVKAVGLNTSVHPLGNWNAPVEVAGDAREDARPVVIHQINSDYTRALGIPLVGGRLFEESDVSNRRHLAIVNQAFVRARLDGRDPLGQTIRIPRVKQPPTSMDDDSFQIVGVVKDTLNRGLTDQIRPEVYLPYTLFGFADRLVALTQADPAGLSRAVISQVFAIDRNQPVTDVRTVETVLDDGIYAGPRFNLALLSVFAVLGLTLAVIGIYGVMSNSVSQQTHDIGVRMAIGATPRHIARMVVKHGSRLLLAGIALGLAGGLLTSRLLSRQIWNVSPFDPVSFGAVSLILFLAGLLACVLPARRAAKADPMEALRYE